MSKIDLIKRKITKGTLILFVIVLVVSLFGFYRLTMSRTLDITDIIEKTVHSYVLNTADGISVGYFQWDDMLNAISTDDATFKKTYFDQALTAFPMIRSMEIISQAFDGDNKYEIHTDIDHVFIDFGIFNSDRSRHLTNTMVRVEIDPNHFFENSIHADDLNYEIQYIPMSSIDGINIISNEKPLQFYHMISSIGIALLIVFLFYSFKRLSVNAHYEIEGLANIVMMLSQKDAYTAEHSKDVAKYALIIAEQLHYSKKQLKLLNKAGYLHDIGKIGISESILNKPDKLTPEEYAEIKKHSTIGYEIVSQFPNLKEVAVIVKYHHELLDGSGYPDGLKGHEIPPAAQILAVADVFSALTTDRPYRKGLSKDMAFKVMSTMSLNQTYLDLLKNELK